MVISDKKNRNLIISEKISGSSVGNIAKDIFDINTDDRIMENTYKDFTIEPIKLFINSFGGSVYDGLALIDIIKNSETPVYTISLGSSMSMGLWIWLAGKKRLIGENSTLMFHDISSGIWDKTSGVRQELNEMMRLQQKIINEITSVSLIKKETLQDYIDRKAEWYIPSEEAISLKLAHGYYNSSTICE